MTNENQPKSSLALFLEDSPPQYRKNPYWSWSGVSKVIQSKQTKSEIDLNQYADLLKCIRNYFRMHFDSFKSEAQVLVLNKPDADTLSELSMPVIQQQFNKDLVIIVPPQQNSYSNTSISENFWYSHLIKNDITPVMRIHSHHELSAYQSPTDYASLNSNSLEVVLGKIYETEPQIAYWLDVSGTDIKSNVFYKSKISDDSFSIKSGKLI